MSDQNPDNYEAQPAFSAAPLNTGPGAVMPLLMPGMLASPTDPYVFDAWNYRPTSGADANDLSGFSVEATDGRIGKVDKASHTLDDGYLLVDTGPWIFGRTVVLPAGTVNHIDRVHRVVYLDRSKEQVKASPELDTSAGIDDASRTSLADYYGSTYTQGQAAAASAPTATSTVTRGTDAWADEAAADADADLGE